MHILVLDNFDSFTYNLVQYCQILGAQTTVIRNNVLTLRKLDHMAPDLILLAPGPGRPEDAGIMPELLTRCVPRYPILGVCLGHQAIGQHFGSNVVEATKPLHGIQDLLHHTDHPTFKGLPNPLSVARYHSLILDTLQAPLYCIARSQSGEIMGLAHQHHPIVGLQFHPESILSSHGHRLLQNVLEYLCPAFSGRANI